MAEGSEPKRPRLNDRIADVFRDPRFTDLVIKCDGREFKVHRVIVCSMSNVLLRQCEGLFKESIAKVIEHTVFDVMTVERMLTYIYTEDYGVEHALDGPGTANRDPRIKQEPGIKQEDVVPGQWPESTSRTPVTSTNDLLIAHARVYGIADYYEIASLKDLAVKKYSSIGGNVTIRTFGRVVDAVYKHTPDRSDRLRGVLHHRLRTMRKELMDNDDFMSSLEDMGHLKEFATVMMREATSEIKNQTVIIGRHQEELSKIENELKIELNSLRAQFDAFKEAKQQEDAQVKWDRQCRDDLVALVNTTSKCRNCKTNWGYTVETDDGGGAAQSGFMLRCRNAKCKCRHYTVKT